MGQNFFLQNISNKSVYSGPSENVVVVLLQRWERKLDPGQGLLPVRSLCILPVSAWFFSGDPGFLPHPKDVHVRWVVRLHRPSLREWACVRPPARGRRPLQGGSCLMLQGWAPATCDPEPKWMGRQVTILLVFSIFLKCIYSLHLFRCSILEVPGSLFRSWAIFFFFFVTRNTP